MIILGINAFHADSAAALLRDGKLVAAAEEERFRRTKHWAGFPAQSIAYCLRAAGAEMGDLDHVAVNQNSRANLAAKLRFTMANPSSLGMAFGRMKNRRARQRIPEMLEQ